jgi:hypothetical protein
MMGRLKSDQGQLFYEFHLGDAVALLAGYVNQRRMDSRADPTLSESSAWSAFPCQFSVNGKMMARANPRKPKEAPPDRLAYR